ATALPTNAPLTAVSGGPAVSGAPARVLFFSVLSEIIRRRGLGQHAGDDLIRQFLKRAMNSSFQMSKLRRLVPQLGYPLALLGLQLVLQVPQHLVHVFHDRPALPLHTHFHRSPAILGNLRSAMDTTLTLSPQPRMAPFGE